MERFSRPGSAILGVIAIFAILVVGSVGAVYLAQQSKSPPTPVAAAATATSTAIPTPSGAVPGTLPAGNDWAQYRSDVYGTGINPEISITSANAAQLAQVWSAQRSQGYFSTPAVVNGVAYVATGISLYAYDLLTGKVLWHYDAKAEKNGGIHASVSVDAARKLAFLSTPETNLYAIDITTGKQRWHAKEGDPSLGAFGWSSPLVLNGKVYIGLASNNDNPCVRGAVFAYDELTGKQVWVHYTEHAGEIGAGVWSSVTAVPEAKLILATTGNPCVSDDSDAEEDAIVALDWNTGKTVWKYTALKFDDCDCDFGEGPVAYTYQGQHYVSAGNKYGVVYTVRLDTNWHSPKLAWSRRIAASDNGRNGGGIFTPPSYADGLVFASGGTPTDHSCQFGVIYALQADTGKIAWQACAHGTSHLYSPAAIVGDLVIIAEPSKVVAYEQKTGKEVWSAASKTAWGGVAVSRGYLLVPVVTGQLTVYSLPTGTHTAAGL